MSHHKLTYNDVSHAYYLNGKRAKSATSVAKIVADSFALEQWRKREVAKGIALEPRLIEKVAADIDNRDALDAITDEAMRVAGSHHRRDRGSQRHRASELIDLGDPLITEQMRNDGAAWQRTLNTYGIEIDRDLIEGFVIYPEYGIAGRFDRIARYQGRPVIIDLKSGENAVKYPQSTAAQLALYARAPFISQSISTSGDRSTVEDWAPPPADLDVNVGYVILLGDGMDVGDLYEVDIAYGWVGAELALNLTQWRRGRDYGKELARRVWGQHDPTPVKKVEPRLVDLISLADSGDELTNLWKQRRSEWTAEHTEGAKKRKRELEVLARLDKRESA